MPRSISQIEPQREGHPDATVRLRLHINARYPESIPVPTVPPQVLQALPKLPDDLEYRFIGDRLILHDVHAHTIVDLIDDAIPH